LKTVEAAQQWLDSLAEHPGCLACMVRPAGQGSLHRSWDPDLSDSGLEQASRSALDMFRILQLHRLPAQYLQWSFERGILHCLRRQDDWVLVVAARRNPPLPESHLASLGQAFMEAA
jgi:hypothetical protein